MEFSLFLKGYINPLYTDGFFLLVLVSYNELGIVHCKIQEYQVIVSKEYCIFCLKIFVTITNNADLMKGCDILNFIWVFTVCKVPV